MKTLSLLIALFLSPMALASQGMIHVKSQHSVADTASKLESLLTEKGMKVFARINHGAGAQSVGKNLRPTELVIFGNPKVGAPLMMCAQSVGIDLPQKALIWEDAQGQAWLSYNDPSYLVKRHEIAGCGEVISKVTKALANFAKGATQ